MNEYQDKTKLQLIEEIKFLKNRIKEFEQSELIYKHAEKSINTDEIKLRNIIEHSSNLFYSHTPDHLITYLSPQTRQFLDCEPEEAKMRWTEFLTENPDNENGFILTEKAIKTGKAQPSYELELVGKKGRKLWVEVNEAPVVEGGKTVAIVGALTDITERKKVNEQLRTEKMFTDNALDSQLDTFFLFEPATRKALRWNRAFREISGYTDEDIAKMPAPISYYGPDDLERIDDFIQKVLVEETDTIELELICKDGRKVPTEYKVSIIKDDQGVPKYIISIGRDISERKQAEKQIRENKYLLEQVLNTNPAIIFVKDKDSRILLANKTMADFYNLSTENVTGQLQADLHKQYSPEHEEIEKWLADDREVIETGQSINFVESGTDSNKLQHWFQTGKYRVDLDQDQKGVLVISEDITERKKAEQALKDSEYLLRESQKVAQLGHYELDVLTGNWTSSKILDNIFGIEDNFIKNVKGWSEILHPNSREEMLRYFNENVLKQHLRFDKEYRIIRISNGEERWVHGLGKLEFDSNGNPVKMIGTIQDITTQKKSEEALQKSRERYRSLYQKTPAMLHSIDQEGCLTNVSEYWLKKMGYSLKEVLGRHSTDFMTEESRRYAKEVILPKFYETGSCRDVPYQYVKKNGEVMDALLTAITENDENGELIYSLSVIVDVTDRRKAEASLRLSEARLRQVIDLVPHYIFAKDHKGRFILANSASAKSMGTTPEEIIGKTELEIAPVKKEAQFFTEDDAAVISSGKPKFIPEGRFTDIEGKLHFLQTIKIPFTASGTHNPSVLGVSVDITERKLAEARVAGLANVLETSLNEIYIYDAETLHFIQANKGARNNLGYSQNELNNLTPLNIKSELNKKSFEKLVKPLRSGKKNIINFQTVQKRKDGSIYPVDIHLQLTKLEDKPVFVAIILDTTERKKAEEEIRKLSHSVEQSPAIVIITDISANIEYVNPKFEEVTGYTAKEVIGKNPSILKSGETSAEEYEILWKTIKSGGEWHGEFHNRKKNGELYWESASISAIKDTGGQLTHYIAIKEDITERKAMDKKLRESHNRLRSFAERLQMIREEERATIAREIHDDLGQSLTALKMDISWLKNNPEMNVETKKTKFDMMLELTNSTIQTVKRIATELRPGILDDLGLIPAIEWQAAEFQNRFNIKCDASINKSDVIIKDEISIAVFRIFQETLTNVARHSGATKVDVNLNFYDDNKLIMDIADNGVGIDQEQINSSKSLGLFGMRERVNILKGKMEIIGDPGKGTKVSVSIPVSKENEGDNE